MTRPSFPLSLRAVPIFAALIVSAAPAIAQGTDAEREACTADAVNLCSDTIPDIPKTTACMKAHLSQLSPGCRAVVASRPDARALAERPARAERERIERSEPTRRARREAPPQPDDTDEPDDDRHYTSAPPDADDQGGRRYIYVAPDGYPTEAPEPSDMERDRARARIGHLCDDDQIDPETCALTERALR